MFEGSRWKRPVSGILLVLGVAGLLYWFSGDRPSDVREMAERANEQPLQGDAIPAAAPGDPATKGSSSVPPPLWHAVDEGSVGRLPFFADEWSPEGRALVRVAGASAAAQAWQVGDRLTIPLPQTGETWRPVIDEIDDGPGRSRAALGKILDAQGHARRIVVTVGPTSMFAWIDTPEGAYELFAGNDLGWLLPSASIMAGFDFSEPDYVLPEEGARGVDASSGRPNGGGS